MHGLEPGPLVRNYAFCMIYPLFRRRCDRAVVGRTKEVPMKRFIVVAAGVASLLLFGVVIRRGRTGHPFHRTRRRRGTRLWRHHLHRGLR